MKDYKNSRLAVYLFIVTLSLYFFLPPLLVAFFFKWLNLNPFGIIRFWHFNPFSADRGIPVYQAFIYVFIVWIGLNILVWGMLLAVGHLYTRFTKGTR